jgi:hypothetical protein
MPSLISAQIKVLESKTKNEPYLIVNGKQLQKVGNGSCGD